MKEKIFKVETLGFTFLAIGFIIPTFVNTQQGAEFAQTAAPFLSIAAFLLLYSANKMQKEELGLQRVELTETRKVFQEQTYTMRLQRIESVFFNINNQRISLNEKLQEPNSGGANPLVMMNNFISKDPKKYEIYKINMEQYLGIIYSMLNVIDNLEIKKEDVTILFETLQMQTTVEELKLIKNYITLELGQDRNSKQFKLIYKFFNKAIMDIRIT